VHPLLKEEVAHITMSSAETALDMASIAGLEMTALPLYIRAAAVGAARAAQHSICRQKLSRIRTGGQLRSHCVVGSYM
jgi:hypothetical protein